MTESRLILSTLSAFAASFWVVRWSLGSRRMPLDRPNSRSLHTRPVPRSGGLGIVAGVLAAELLVRSPDHIVLLACFLGLAALSFADDLYGLPVVWRLSAHVAAAVLFVGFGLEHPVSPIDFLWLIPVVVWVTNLYNFMDGSDGLAGGMALFGFSTLGMVAWLGGDPALAAMALGVVASAGAFLLFNFPPARVFMGDVGSIPLGFMAAGMALLGWQRGLWALSFPLLVFSPFIVDATVTLVQRILRGEKMWQAHNSHYYQRLVRLGWGHNRTVLTEYGLMAAVCSSALWATKTG